MTADHELHAALMADAAPRPLRPPMVTPRPWPDHTVPTVEQLAEWLRVCTVAEREWYVSRSREAADAARECWQMDHAGQLARRGALR